MGWLIKEAFLYISKAHRVRGREVQISLSYKFIHLKNALFLTRSLSVLLMFCPAQSERYFCPVPLNTAVSFKTKQNESIFDPIPSQEGLLFVLV